MVFASWECLDNLRKGGNFEVGLEALRKYGKCTSGIFYFIRGYETTNFVFSFHVFEKLHQSLHNQSY